MADLKDLFLDLVNENRMEFNAFARYALKFKGIYATKADGTAQIPTQVDGNWFISIHEPTVYISKDGVWYDIGNSSSEAELEQIKAIVELYMAQLLNLTSGNTFIGAIMTNRNYNGVASNGLIAVRGINDEGVVDYTKPAMIALDGGDFFTFSTTSNIYSFGNHTNLSYLVFTKYAKESYGITSSTDSDPNLFVARLIDNEWYYENVDGYYKIPANYNREEGTLPDGSVVIASFKFNGKTIKSDTLKFLVPVIDVSLRNLLARTLSLEEDMSLVMTKTGINELGGGESLYAKININAEALDVLYSSVSDNADDITTLNESMITVQSDVISLQATMSQFGGLGDSTVFVGTFLPNQANTTDVFDNRISLYPIDIEGNPDTTSNAKYALIAPNLTLIEETKTYINSHTNDTTTKYLYYSEKPLIDIGMTKNGTSDYLFIARETEVEGSMELQYDLSDGWTDIPASDGYAARSSRPYFHKLASFANHDSVYKINGSTFAVLCNMELIDYRKVKTQLDLKADELSVTSRFDSVNADIGEIESWQSSFSVTPYQISTLVSEYDSDQADMYSAINQNATDITFKVGAYDSSGNMVENAKISITSKDELTGQITIDADNIDITGIVTFINSGSDATTIIHGDRIQTGTIASVGNISWIDLDDGSFSFANNAMYYNSLDGLVIEGKLTATDTSSIAGWIVDDTVLKSSDASMYLDSATYTTDPDTVIVAKFGLLRVYADGHVEGGDLANPAFVIDGTGATLIQIVNTDIAGTTHGSFTIDSDAINYVTISAGEAVSFMRGASYVDINAAGINLTGDIHFGTDTSKIYAGGTGALKWDSTTNKWYAGVSGSEVEISLLGHTHDFTAIESLPWSKLTDVPTPKIKLTGDILSSTYDINLDNNTVEILTSFSTTPSFENATFDSITITDTYGVMTKPEVLGGSGIELYTNVGGEIPLVKTATIYSDSTGLTITDENSSKYIKIDSTGLKIGTATVLTDADLNISNLATQTWVIENYYTKTALGNGTANVHWDSLTNIPTNLVEYIHTHTNKTILDNIPTTATEGYLLGWSGTAWVSTAPYVHPSTHPATMIVTDENHRFVTDTQISTWNSISTNIDWNDILNKPDPTITFSGDVTGSVTLTDMGSGTAQITVSDDSHNHSRTTVSSVNWSALYGTPSIEITGAVTGSADIVTTANDSKTTIDVSVNHNHNDIYYTESEADSLFVNSSGDTMTGNLNMGLNEIEFGVGETTGSIIYDSGIKFKAPGLSLFDSLTNMFTVNVAGITYKSNKVWHEGNDGSASGLDADLLDGKHLSDLSVSITGDMTGSASFVAGVASINVSAGSNIVLKDTDFTFTLNKINFKDANTYLQINDTSVDFVSNKTIKASSTEITGDLTVDGNLIYSGYLDVGDIAVGDIKLLENEDRIVIEQSGVPKIAIGYLNGIDAEHTDPDQFGIYVGAANAIYVDPVGSTSMFNGDWLVKEDANIIIQNGTTELIRLGNEGSDMGLFIKNVSGDLVGSFTGSRITLGKTLEIDSEGTLTLRNSVSRYTSEIFHFNSGLIGAYGTQPAAYGVA